VWVSQYLNEQDTKVYKLGAITIQKLKDIFRKCSFLSSVFNDTKGFKSGVYELDFFSLTSEMGLMLVKWCDSGVDWCGVVWWCFTPINTTISHIPPFTMPYYPM